jgi:N-acetylneuraminate synthase
MHIDIIAEIGINHNGSIEKAKRLIDIASVAGCDYVKFQKRNPDICVPEDQKLKPKKVPWHKEPITYIDYKREIEFSGSEYEKLFSYAYEKGLIPFASIWDLDSAEFMIKLTNICKIPSAKITDLELLDFCNKTFKTNMISTGMSTEEEIVEAINILDPSVIFHTNSVYPSPIESLDLNYITWLKEAYPTKEIGYSNHYYGIVPIFSTIGMGVNFIEVHICEDHNDWGSDQSSSIEPNGLFKLVKGIRDLEKAFSIPKGSRTLLPGEEIKRKTLRN